MNDHQQQPHHPRLEVRNVGLRRVVIQRSDPIRPIDLASSAPLLDSHHRRHILPVAMRTAHPPTESRWHYSILKTYDIYSVLSNCVSRAGVQGALERGLVEPAIGETESSRMCAGVRRAASLLMATIALVTFGVSITHAQWPTTCVELNDLAEAAVGHSPERRHLSAKRTVIKLKLSVRTITATMCAERSPGHWEAQAKRSPGLGQRAASLSTIWLKPPAATQATSAFTSGPSLTTLRPSAPVGLIVAPM